MDKPLDDFSAVSDGATFLYRRHTMLPHAYEIVRSVAGAIETVGEYMVLDAAENPVLTEKKMMNLVALMNGHRDLIDLGGESGRRLYFHVMPGKGLHDRQQIMFRERGTEGVTRENALLSIDEEYFHGSH